MKKLWRTPVADEVRNELAFHLAITTRVLIQQVMPLDKARAEADRRFGAMRVDPVEGLRAE